jgi:hypothetical protein
MKLPVVPESRRAEIKEIIRTALGHRGAPEHLSPVVVRLAAQDGWSVEPSGLGDPVLERGYGDVVEEALKRVRG